MNISGPAAVAKPEMLFYAPGDLTVTDYRKAREEMQELVKAQKNIELFFAEEKDAQEKQQTR